ncbi:MAG: DUF3501 family protein [Candidatus Dormibacteraeota bacterium]|nr:DUF3501 family protein [Candidatus Dormibacteraeota bacterium]
MPEPLDPGDVRTGAAYEEVRSGERQSLVEAQRHRRVSLGTSLELVFESRDSVRLALEEMLRSERVSDPDVIAGDAAAFSELIPGEGRIGATLYVIAGDAAELGTTLSGLADVRAAVYLEIDGKRVPGEVLDDEAAEQMSAASFVTFRLSPELRERWRRGAAIVAGVEHPRHAERSTLTDEQRAAIAEGL